jgi:hypothetical protein
VEMLRFFERAATALTPQSDDAGADAGTAPTAAQLTELLRREPAPPERANP